MAKFIRVPLTDNTSALINLDAIDFACDSLSATSRIHMRRGATLHASLSLLALGNLIRRATDDAPRYEGPSE